MYVCMYVQVIVPVSASRQCQQVNESVTCTKRTILPRPTTVNQSTECTSPYLALQLQTPGDERRGVAQSHVSVGQPAPGAANTVLTQVGCNNSVMTRTGSAGTVTSDRTSNFALMTRACSSGTVPVSGGRAVVARAASSGTVPLAGAVCGTLLARAASSGTVPSVARQSSQRRNSFLEQLLTQGILMTIIVNYHSLVIIIFFAKIFFDIVTV